MLHVSVLGMPFLNTFIIYFDFYFLKGEREKVREDT